MLTDTKSLIDLANGTISREIFVSEQVYQEELEQVFTRAWLLVGHESQVPKPGDYFVSSMGEESVILCRDREGHLHVFLNSCRHRGMKVCRYDEGNTPVFTCPYHGWSYATDGRLVGVPFFKDAYQEKLDKSQWGLVEVPQVYNYKGTVWANWDPSAPSLLEYLGEYKIYLDLGLDSWDGGDGGTEVIGGVHKWLMPCNWKFPSENFSGDYAHNISHRSVDMVGIGPSGVGRRDTNELGPRGLLVYFPDRGHKMSVNLQPIDAPAAPAYQNSPLVAEYFRHCEEERRRRVGQWSRVTGGPAHIFPNTSPHARQPRSMAVWHPRGPHQTEAWRWYLVDKGAPQEVKDFLRSYYMRYAGPAGMTEQDDMENWSYAHTASMGTIARRHPYNYQMGIEAEGTRGFEDNGLKLPGVVKAIPEVKATEESLRAFYKRWSEFMAAESWKELATWRNGPGDNGL